MTNHTCKTAHKHYDFLIGHIEFENLSIWIRTVLLYLMLGILFFMIFYPKHERSIQPIPSAQISERKPIESHKNEYVLSNREKKAAAAYLMLLLSAASNSRH